MPVDSPTRVSPDAKQTVWTARAGLARVVRIVVLLIPVLASGALAWFLGNTVPPSRLGIGFIPWFFCVATVSTAVLFLAERILRRVAPLPALLTMALVFPDAAPERYKIALRAGSSKRLADRIEEVKQSGIALSPDEDYAAQMLELLAMLSAHDRLTRGHCERVRAYTDLIIDEMELPTAAANKLRWAALLHDLGKLMVPAEILNSPEKPTDEEWEIMKSHTWQGERLVAPIAGWLGEWSAAVGQHHERWDGGGYPNGLAQTDIHLGARIVAVADSFDVMTSARSYKKPMDANAAREEVARCASTQFDPEVVRAFLGIGVSRLRFIAGPISWFSAFAGLPSLSTVSAPAAVAAVSAASVAVVGGAVAAVPDFDEEPPPEAIAFTDAPVTTPTTSFIATIDETTTPPTATVAPAPGEPTTTPPTTEFVFSLTIPPRSDTETTTTTKSTVGGTNTSGGATSSTSAPGSPTSTSGPRSSTTTSPTPGSTTTSPTPSSTTSTTTTTPTNSTTTTSTTTTSTTTSSTTTTTTAPPPPPVGFVISEFSAAGANPSGDFVELYNGTGGTVSLDGSYLRLANNVGVFHSVPLSGTVTANSFYLVARQGTSVAGNADATFPVNLPLSIGIGLDNGAGYIDVVGTRARTENKPVVVPASAIAEGTGLPPFDPGSTSNPQSMVRKYGLNGGSCIDTNNNSNDWIRAFSASQVTPRGRSAGPSGCGSAGTSPGAPTNVVISEIRTDGPGSGENEFVELFNPSAAPRSLAGLALVDEDGDVEYLFTTEVINARGFFVIGGSTYDGPSDESYQDNGVKNGGGLELRVVATGLVIDQIRFGSSSPELPPLGGRLHHSYQRRFGGCIDTNNLYTDFEHAFVQDPRTKASGYTVSC